MAFDLTARIGARMWSRTTSLRPIADRIGPVAVVYEKGEHMLTAKGERLKSRSTEYYLATAESTVTDISALSGEVARYLQMLLGDAAIGRLLDKGALGAVVWVAIFGDRGAVRIEDIAIDKTPFGDRIGLVLENYTEFDATGNPRQLLIGPAAHSSSA